MGRKKVCTWGFTMLEQHQYRRWYDINPIVSEAIHAWQYFPPSLQQELAKYVHQMIMKDRLPIRYKGVFRYVAMLLVLHDKNKNRRWYDRDPVLKKTMSLLPLVEYGGLVDVSTRILKLQAYINNGEIKAGSLPAREIEKMIDYVFKNPHLV